MLDNLLPTQGVTDGGFSHAYSLERDFERDEKAFREMLPSLLRTHEKKFVAVANRQLADEDDDEIRLAERIERRFRDRFVLIRRVIPAEIEDEMPSPETDA